MDISRQLSFAIVLAMLCVLVTGNYMINHRSGMCPIDNARDTQMWGAGFFMYAVFDYLILMI